MIASVPQQGHFGHEEYGRNSKASITRNETSELIDTDIFDFALVEALRARGVFTVRPEDREAALEEMEFNLSGLGDQTLSAGSMKSPNFFIKSLITESSWKEGAQRILEHVIRCELRAVETQLVVWTDDIHYKRRLAPRRNNVAW